MTDVAQIRSLVQHCWAWGAVMAHREAGGLGYPSFAEIHGQRYRPVGGMTLSNLGAAFADVERTIRNQPPLVRGLLYFQYGRPHVTEEAQRSVHDYVDFVFGDNISIPEKTRVARAVRRVRRHWARQAAYDLFGGESSPAKKEKEGN